ncbi:hypothetical protein HPP92_027699 [Vanilla planifolia]|uniref:Amino acid transporter transmembrane domain-containing protein n=1 Tax=Vanilla planifolia TaxID=51239 RepID=A0A835U552_VANPL|nr:hypothetical protein HPP92_027699 [Vanilla planifolia]
MEGPALAAPLLDGRGKRGARGGTTWAQTLGNIVVSIVGTEVLGLPYAFRMAGWLAGSLGVFAAGVSTYLCMLLLVQCRNKLEEDSNVATGERMQIRSYGDLGAKAFGTTGRYATELLVLISQAGVCLSFIHSLSSLAPVSAFADTCNVLAMAIVIKKDFQLFDQFSWRRSAFNGAWGLPFAGGVALFCFEGFSMTLALEASMADRKKFRWVLLMAFIAITIIYVCFGIFGFLAYGDDTKDIITLNLPNDWSAISVKVGLCVALAFTFPIMMHPIYEIIEMKLSSIGWFEKLRLNARAERLGHQAARVLVLVAVAVVASCIPGFGAFISLVGSTVCALLSFVLPATFHLLLVGSEVQLWQRAMDYFIIAFGLAFAAYGTYDALSDHRLGS